MKDELKIVPMEQPAWEVIGGGISSFNTQQAGDDHGRSMCFTLQDDSGNILGGVIAATYWEWLYIDLMWLQEDQRGKGYGSQLLVKAEDEGRKRGAEYAHLDTFSFQARGFYEKHGYQVFGKLDDFPKGHQRYYLKKDL